MPDPTASSVADRFALILEGLRRATAAAGGRNRSAAPIMLLIWTRLGRTAARFARLAARLGAGALPIVAAAPPDCGLRPVSRRRDPGAPSNGAPVLPRGFAWLLRQVPEAAPFGSQLRHLLSDPEMQALIVAAPQFGRVLRPLCRMLGIAPDEGLALPARAPTRRRVRRTDPPRPATQRPATHRPVSSLGAQAGAPDPLRRQVPGRAGLNVPPPRHGLIVPVHQQIRVRCLVVLTFCCYSLS